jgi:hypothetical protein
VGRINKIISYLLTPEYCLLPPADRPLPSLRVKLIVWITARKIAHF